MRQGLRALAPLPAALLALFAPALGRAQPVLERVVMLSRHGVRAPTATPQALAAETGRTWPAFPVAPGELTPHGATALDAMGGYLRRTYVSEGLLPSHACPVRGAVQVWADGGDARTRMSGQRLAETLAPGCGVQAGHGPDGAPDPLFDAASTGVCPMDPQAALQAVQARTEGEAALVDAASAHGVAVLKSMLGPQACRMAAAACLEGPTTLTAGRQGPRLSGPLAVAAGVGENLLLEYAEGLPAADVGWGGGTAEAVGAVVAAHERAADLLRRTPYIAVHNGAVMAQTMLDLLEGGAPLNPHAPRLAAGARLVLIAGHDTNLSNVAGVLGLAWSLPGEPDGTAPDTTLALELWREPATGTRTVRAVVYSQSLEQLRRASPLDAADPPGVTPVQITLCGSGICRPATLTAAVRARLPPECLS